jgi:hypothetical protein
MVLSGSLEHRVPSKWQHRILADAARFREIAPGRLGSGKFHAKCLPMLGKTLFDPDGVRQ